MNRKKLVATAARLCVRYDTTMAHAFRRALGIEAEPDRSEPRPTTSAELEAAERKRREYERMMGNRYGVLERVR